MKFDDYTNAYIGFTTNCLKEIFRTFGLCQKTNAEIVKDHAMALGSGFIPPKGIIIPGGGTSEIAGENVAYGELEEQMKQRARSPRPITIADLQKFLEEFDTADYSDQATKCREQLKEKSELPQWSRTAYNSTKVVLDWYNSLAKDIKFARTQVAELSSKQKPSHDCG